MAQIGISSLKLILVKTFLIGIEGLCVPMKNVLELHVVMGTPLKCVSLYQSFMMIDMALTYNVILERPFLHQINVVINTRYFEVPNSEGSSHITGKSDNLKTMCTTCIKSKKMLISDYKRSLKERIKIRTEAIKKLKDICLGG
jgi:hypothetical protein